jgi:3-oxoacyl-[acyl-carrier-protein] synthase-3
VTESDFRPRTPAVLELCKKRGIDPLEIDCIIVATVTPDMMLLATANIVADAVGAKKLRI